MSQRSVHCRSTSPLTAQIEIPKNQNWPTNKMISSRFELRRLSHVISRPDKRRELKPSHIWWGYRSTRVHCSLKNASPSFVNITTPVTAPVELRNACNVVPEFAVPFGLVRSYAKIIRYGHRQLCGTHCVVRSIWYILIERRKSSAKRPTA